MSALSLGASESPDLRRAGPGVQAYTASKVHGDLNVTDSAPALWFHWAEPGLRHAAPPGAWPAGATSYWGAGGGAGGAALDYERLIARLRAWLAALRPPAGPSDTLVFQV